MKFPKDIICSEEYGKFNLVNFGYAFKALADLTSETTLEQKADKLRKDATQVIKEGCRDKGSLPSYFNNVIRALKTKTPLVAFSSLALESHY